MLTAVLVIAALHAAADGAAVTARAVLHPAEIPFHHVALFVVEAEGPAETEILVESWSEGPPGLRITPGEPEITLLLDGRKRFVQSFTLSPTLARTYTLPQTRVLADGAEVTLLDAEELVVRDLTPEEKAEAATAADLMMLADLESGGAARWTLNAMLFATIVLVAAVAATGGLLAAYRNVHTRLFPPRALSPGETAAAGLASLENQFQAEGITCDAFYLALSGLLRAYIEGRFTLPIAGQSTPEFVSSTLASLQLSQTQAEAVGELLREFDRVKYAQHVPDRAAQVKSLQRVRALIGEMESQAATVESQALRGAA